jgi:fluoride ion exporter CrcB/FEX
VNISDSTVTNIPNGSGAAAMLAAAIGSFVLAIFAFVGDKSIPIKNSLNFYKPTGPLSGVTTVAILAWFLSWLILERRWGKQVAAMRRINRVCLTLLAVSILLTFPPIVDLL